MSLLVLEVMISDSFAGDGAGDASVAVDTPPRLQAATIVSTSASLDERLKFINHSPLRIFL